MAASTVPESTRVARDDSPLELAPEIRIPGQPSRLNRLEPALIGGGAVIGFLLAWQLVAALRIVPELFLPGPADIWKALYNWVADGSIWKDLWISSQELVVGYLLALGVGLPLGLLTGWYRRVAFAIDPFISFFYSTPRIALLPLLIIWLGIGVNSKIAVIFLGAFFPVVINTAAGVRNLDPGLIKTARSFGASDLQLFRTVALPGAVPFILAGARLGVGHALIGVVVGELVAAQAGIGYVMATAGATFQTAKVFAGLFIIATAGLLMTGAIGRVEQRFQAWRPRS